MVFGKCQICLEKDKRINDLQEQLQLLRPLVFPKNYSQVIAEAHELDSILSGSEPSALNAEISDSALPASEEALEPQELSLGEF